MIPPGFRQAVQLCIERRLKIAAGTCTMTVYAVTNQALTECGVYPPRSSTRGRDKFTGSVMQAIYAMTAQIMEQYNGKLEMYIFRNRKHTGPSRRVYKFG